ncbi:hypothetical protein [Brevibacillus centrosporus]|uniref:hypothetical protein n=1 Tax=Brevibacillus centrosporus TaxID=54910 RepID=UPI003B02AAAF
MRENKVFPVNPKKIAKARDFYRIRNLSPHEISIIEQGFIKDFWTKDIQELNKNWITVFTKAFRIKAELERRGQWNEQKESELDVLLNNLAEDFHNKIEDLALPYLNFLKNGNTDFVNNDEGLSRFLCKLNQPIYEKVSSP